MDCQIRPYQQINPTFKPSIFITPFILNMKNTPNSKLSLPLFMNLLTRWPKLMKVTTIGAIYDQQKKLTPRHQVKNRDQNSEVLSNHIID